MKPGCNQELYREDYLEVIASYTLSGLFFLTFQIDHSRSQKKKGVHSRFQIGHSRRQLGVQEAIALSISRAASMGDFSPLVF